jgi:hypothetical protein
MEEKTVMTMIWSDSIICLATSLLKDGWLKNKKGVFFKRRNHYDITVENVGHPLWQITISPKTEYYDDRDWKLKKDLKSLDNIGKPRAKKLYINEDNIREIKYLLYKMQEGNFNLLYDENYIIFQDKEENVNIFKIAAKAPLKYRKDGWFIGNKKIFE